MRDEPNVHDKVPKYVLIRSHKECVWLNTARRWPWKLETSKECVTTHLPKPVASKMDGAKVHYRFRTITSQFVICRLA